MSFISIAPMGKGKTLIASVFAKRYSKKHENNNIFGNYHLKLPNFYFTPFMFLPLTELENCLIICDDIYALSNLNRFTGIVANLSRKKNIKIILTAQYYTMITPNLRTLIPIEVLPDFDKETGILNYTVIDKANNTISEHKILNSIEYVKDIYDTNEVVVFPTESNIISEIMKYSKTLDDIDMNLELYSGNQAVKKRLRKEILSRIQNGVGSDYEIEIEFKKEKKTKTKRN